MLTFRNATHDPGRQISLYLCTFIQKRIARLNSEAASHGRSAESIVAPPPAAPRAEDAVAPPSADLTNGGGGGGNGGGSSGDREPETRLGVALTAEAAALAGLGVAGGPCGSLRNSPDVLGSGAGGGRGNQPPPTLPPPLLPLPATGLSATWEE